MRLSLILPAYNEQENVRKNLPIIYSAMRKVGDFEIILAEDGSSDNTAQEARRFAKRHKNVRVLSFKKNVGKGFAIKKAISVARGKVIGYMDVDLAIPPRYALTALRLVEAGNTVVFGSRYNPRSRISRAPMRLLGSVSYNKLIRLLLNSEVDDHQCGFKFWDAKFIKGVLHEVRDNRWFFDTEILIIAQRRGIRPRSLAIRWVERDGTVPPLADMRYQWGEIMRMRSSR